jgi:hypothetical protein
MKSRENKPATMMAPAPAPTPMPILAPVERPELDVELDLAGWEESVELARGSFDEELLLEVLGGFEAAEFVLREELVAEAVFCDVVVVALVVEESPSEDVVVLGLVVEEAPSVVVGVCPGK